MINSRTLIVSAVIIASLICIIKLPLKLPHWIIPISNIKKKIYKEGFDEKEDIYYEDLNTKCLEDEYECLSTDEDY